MQGFVGGGIIVICGMFDGVHQGHRALINAAREIGQPLAVTFNPPPKPTLLIQPLRERVALLEKTGAQVEILQCDEAFLAMQAEEFLQSLCKRLPVKGFVCGENHHFGAGGRGNAETLRSFCSRQGLAFKTVPPVIVEGRPLSSSAIREALTQGDMENAAKMLGRAYSYTQAVTPGRGIAGANGVPTANLALNKNLVKPANGVYACSAIIDRKKITAVANIGAGPTIGDNRPERIEVHLLTPLEKPLEGQQITVLFHKKLREECVFENTEALFTQIRRDAEAALLYNSRGVLIE